NIISVNTPAWSSASAWATAELQNASELGIIPDILKGADMTKPITREEFCELAVLLYEKVTESTATPASPNPFTDTVNSQILKAYELGITTGTSTTTFSPKALINREQCATMLFRAIKAIAPNADYSVAGIKDFPDQKYISAWAADGTKYMSKLGIIKGDSYGNFMPKATTTAQVATGYGMATREAAVLMTVRTYQTMD
ncbi:MAG: S-layer homology domain-containing protein, partial [Clostridiaceae bacterium]|nr:S-layer homology domain-containing protein [Clostridiaceae bacterium]